MPVKTSTVAKRAWVIIWCMRLDSALRTAFSCAIVGGATLYGPKFLTNHFKFVAFSYLTAVLIVSDARLGDTFRGCWHAFCATAQVVPLAMLGRWSTDFMSRMPVGVAALVVLVASFIVVLPESTHMMAKRIAFGQIVLVCTNAVISVDGFIHPLDVAASTALGAFASVFALLLPFPGLAYFKVKELHRLYAENDRERTFIYLRALDSNDGLTRRELISQARLLTETGTKLLKCIENLEDGMQWERPRIVYGEPCLLGPGDRLQLRELAMRGIEYSLVSWFSFPVRVVDRQRISNVLKGLLIQLQQEIDKVEPETRGAVGEPKLLILLEPIFPVEEYESVSFFFSCMDMMLNGSADARVTTKELQTRGNKTEFSIVGTFKSWILKLTSRRERLEFAFKCSLSLGLAVLFGLIFDKENGCWAGLTIAISFVMGKQPIFTVANTRAQGTAIGSAYGVICCFLFRRVEFRFLALIPWIIFTSFLRHSRTYGQTGGTSAAIGALLILGRKNYGNPNEFAIIRLAEVFIGLSCFILVELFMQPTRAATLTKSHLCHTLYALQDCIEQTSLYNTKKKTLKVPEFLEIKDKQRHLESLVRELKQLATDADLEPDFWYFPFRASCYNKVVGSLSNMADMVYFIGFNFESLSKLPKSCAAAKEEFLEHMSSELKLVHEVLSSTLKCLDTGENLNEAQRDSQEAVNEFCDLEEGKLQNKEVVDNNDKNEQNESGDRRLGAIRFCMTSLRKHMVEAEISIKEIAKWDNCSSK